jgi:hypothetical protein
MKKILSSVLVIAVMAISTVCGQEGTGGGGSAPRRGPEVPRLGMPFRLSGEVLQVDVARNAIQIRNKQNKKPAGFALDPKCKIKADAKSFDKKELKLDEIEPGYEVELTVRQADSQVIEMKVKKPKKESDS